MKTNIYRILMQLPQAVPFFKSCTSSLTRSLLKSSLTFLATCFFITYGILPAHCQVSPPGQVTGWGNDDFSEVTNAKLLSDVVTISARAHNNLALKQDGSLIQWGITSLNPKAIATGLLNIKAMVASQSNGLALTQNGQLLPFWADLSTPIPIPSEAVNVAAIAAGNTHYLALTSTGKVIAWGPNDVSGATDVPGDLPKAIGIGAGSYHSLAVLEDGSVIAWGARNLNFQVSPPDDLKDVMAVAAGAEHSVALKKNGTLRVWGNDQVDQLKVPSNINGSDTFFIPIIAIAAGDYHTIALRSDGTVVSFGNDKNAPANLANVKAIAAGRYHGLALTIPPAQKQYIFSGFLAPIYNPPSKVNMGKANRTYPVKFQLKNPDGSFVTNLSAVKSVNYSIETCGSFAATPVELLETSMSGDSVLRYDADNNQFIYNWKTPSLGCYALWLTFDSGQVFPAYFNLTK